MAYPVGGAVRDHLMGKTPSDVDWVVVGATPEIMTQLGFHPVGRDFPVFLHPETGEEYALARTERKTGRGYHGFSFSASPEVTLEEDLARRDLTINAMAIDENGQLIDPYGGRRDLAQRRLRHITSAFAEDPLRVLRVARFLARWHQDGYVIVDETLALMKAIVASGEMQYLTPERVWKETERALAEPSPRAYFETLRECGALAVLFPEIDRLYGVPNPPKWHPEVDTGIHTMMVLEQASLLTNDPMTRFAALCHDLGKGVTPQSQWPSHKGHEHRGVPIIEDLCERLKAPKAWRELATLASEFHLYAHRATELKPSTLVRLFEQLDAFRRPERFAQWLLVCEADFRGRTGYEQRPYPQGDFLRAAFQAAQSVNAGQIAKRCDNPQKIPQQIHLARVHAVRQWKQGAQTHGLH